MFKLFVNFYLFFLLILSASAQEHEGIINDAAIKEAKRLTKLQAKYYDLGVYQKFKSYTDSILVHAKKHHLKDLEIDATIRLGVYYKKMDKYEESMKYYLEALKLSDNIPESHKKKTVILINLGNVYNLIGYHKKANKTFKEAEHYIDNFGGPDEYKMAVYTGLSDSFSGNNDFKTSLSYLEKAKKIGEKLNRDDIIINALNSMSDNYLQLKDYQKALNFSTKAEALYTPKQSIEQRTLSLYLTGASLVGLQKYDEAILPLQMAQAMSFTNQFLKIEMDVHKNLAIAFEKQGLLKRAISEQKGYVLAKERYLTNLSKAKRLEVTQELAKTEDLLQQENTFKWSSILISFIVILILIGILFIYIKKKKQAELQAFQLKESQVLLKDENEVLKTKILKLVQQNNTVAASNNKEKISAKKSSLSKVQQQEYVQHILDYMEKEKPYLEPDIKQLDIAKSLNMSVHLFSEVLNICFQKNFNNFINLYRVDKAKELIKNPKYANYKLLAIGYDSGFPSKASFNRVFKQLVEQTPSEYRQKQLLKETDSVLN